MKNGLLRNLNDVDSAGQGRKRDKEEGLTRRVKKRKKEVVKKKMKKEKVARGRIVDPAVLFQSARAPFCGNSYIIAPWLYYPAAVQSCHTCHMLVFFS